MESAQHWVSVRCRWLGGGLPLLWGTGGEKPLAGVWGVKAFFDSVDHQKLMGKLRERIADPRLLKLILKYLKAGAIRTSRCVANA